MKHLVFIMLMATFAYAEDRIHDVKNQDVYVGRPLSNKKMPVPDCSFGKVKNPVAIKVDDIVKEISDVGKARGEVDTLDWLNEMPMRTAVQEAADKELERKIDDFYSGLNWINNPKPPGPTSDLADAKKARANRILAREYIEKLENPYPSRKLEIWSPLPDRIKNFTAISRYSIPALPRGQRYETLEPLEGSVVTPGFGKLVPNDAFRFLANRLSEKPIPQKRNLNDLMVKKYADLVYGLKYTSDFAFVVTYKDNKNGKLDFDKVSVVRGAAKYEKVGAPILYVKSGDSERATQDRIEAAAGRWLVQPKVTTEDAIYCDAKLLGKASE